MMTMNRLSCDTESHYERVTKTIVHYTCVALHDVNNKPGLCCLEILVFLRGVRQLKHGRLVYVTDGFSKLFQVSEAYDTQMGTFRLHLLCAFCVFINNLGHGNCKDEEMRDDEHSSSQSIEETD